MRLALKVPADHEGHKLVDGGVLPVEGVDEIPIPQNRYPVGHVEYLLELVRYENDRNIPRTSNSLEGHFSHIKDILSIHRGMKKPLKEKVLEVILLNSSIVPKKEKLKN